MLWRFVCYILFSSSLYIAVAVAVIVLGLELGIDTLVTGGLTCGGIGIAYGVFS